MLLMRPGIGRKPVIAHRAGSLGELWDITAIILAMCKRPRIGLLQKISCILSTAQKRFVIVITIIAVKWLQSVGVTMSYYI